jgi:hypothetical protein
MLAMFVVVVYGFQDFRLPRLSVNSKREIYSLLDYSPVNSSIRNLPVNKIVIKISQENLYGDILVDYIMTLLMLIVTVLHEIICFFQQDWKENKDPRGKKVCYHKEHFWCMESFIYICHILSSRCFLLRVNHRGTDHLTSSEFSFSRG